MTVDADKKPAYLQGVTCITGINLRQSYQVLLNLPPPIKLIMFNYWEFNKFVTYRSYLKGGS